MRNRMKRITFIFLFLTLIIFYSCQRTIDSDERVKNIENDEKNESVKNEKSEKIKLDKNSQKIKDFVTSYDWFLDSQYNNETLVFGLSINKDNSYLAHNNSGELACEGSFIIEDGLIKLDFPRTVYTSHLDENLRIIEFLTYFKNLYPLEDQKSEYSTGSVSFPDTPYDFESTNFIDENNKPDFKGVVFTDTRKKTETKNSGGGKYEKVEVTPENIATLDSKDILLASPWYFFMELYHSDVALDIGFGPDGTYGIAGIAGFFAWNGNYSMDGDTLILHLPEKILATNDLYLENNLRVLDKLFPLENGLRKQDSTFILDREYSSLEYIGRFLSLKDEDFSLSSTIETPENFETEISGQKIKKVSVLYSILIEDYTTLFSQPDLNSPKTEIISVFSNYEMGGIIFNDKLYKIVKNPLTNQILPHLIANVYAESINDDKNKWYKIGITDGKYHGTYSTYTGWVLLSEPKKIDSENFFYYNSDDFNQYVQILLEKGYIEENTE